jgi:hypothetical protein
MEAGLIERFARLGIGLEAKILLPRKGIAMEPWAVVACDQYTSEPSWWEEADRLVGTLPSTLRCIIPEAYLDETEVRMGGVGAAMADYREKGLLAEIGEGLVYVERSTPFHERRRGLVAAIDLEFYDYRPGSNAPIRSTERTVESRIPARLALRRAALYEFPHVLMLVDDDDDELIGNLERSRDSMPLLYDFSLMQGAGRISGRLVADPDLLAGVAEALEILASPERSRSRYGSATRFSFAVGDGNHSLASAKAYWEELKALGARSDSPARYALVEILSIRDPGLSCLPIHRILYGVDPSDFSSFLLGNEGFGPVSPGKPGSAAGGPGSDGNLVRLRSRAEISTFALPDPESLAVAVVEPALERYLAVTKGSRVDYIHGDDVLERLSMEPGAVGVELPPIEGKSLFGTVVRSGTLPRKSFSLGEACEKRFYIEGRSLR